MDAAMTTLTKNDGIVSLLHCQERNYKEDFVLKFYGQSLNTSSASDSEAQSAEIYLTKMQIF